ncbi:hypothetical protein DICA3_F12420 [Diutina catenulata]
MTIDPTDPVSNVLRMPATADRSKLSRSTNVSTQQMKSTFRGQDPLNMANDSPSVQANHRNGHTHPPSSPRINGFVKSAPSTVNSPSSPTNSLLEKKQPSAESSRNLPAPPGTEYTLDEIKQHDTPDDLWMIIYNKVYDVTLFASDHPGGVEVLYDCGGVDATEAFDDVAHSDDAVTMLAPYYLGDVVTSQQTVYPNQRKAAPAPIIKKPLRGRRLSDCDRVFNEKIAICSLLGVAFIALVVFISIQKVKWNF